VAFEGRISSVSGTCPTVTFTVRGMSIVADNATKYEKSKCGDVRSGRSVKGEGTTQSNGTVRATELRVKEDDDDDN
jgi:hypothetical protein